MRFLLSTVATVMLSATTLLAQTPPSFAGNWVVSREKTTALVAGQTIASADAARESVSADGGFTGVTVSAGSIQEQTIAQSATTLTIERTVGPDHETISYKLDGTETINQNGRTTLTSSTHWETDKFVTEGTQVTTTDRGAITCSFKEVRSIDNDGAMVVETTRQFDGGAQSTTLLVFVKRK